MEEPENWEEDNEWLEQLLPELGCLMKIDSIMTAYVPHELPEFGVSPVLPAIYALRVIVEEGSYERCGDAIVLLQYIHSCFPDVSLRTYVELLVDLKTKATFNGIFSASDDEERYAILDKFFPLETSCYRRNSKAEDLTSSEEYSAHLHGNARNGIGNIIASKQERLDFQYNQILYPGHGVQLHENLLKNLRSYLNNIRSQLPCPKLFQLSETYRSREERSTRANRTAEDTEAIPSPPPDQERHEVPISPSDESHPGRKKVVPGTDSMPATSVPSNRKSIRLFLKAFEKKAEKFTSSASTSSEAPRRKVKATRKFLQYSTTLTDSDDGRPSENVTASTSDQKDSPVTHQPPRRKSLASKKSRKPPRRKRLTSKKSRSNSKAGTGKERHHLAATCKAPESRKSKLSGHTTLRTEKNHSPAPIASMNDVAKILPSEGATIHVGLVEEEVITQDSDKVSRVSQQQRRRKRARTRSDTDTLAPTRKQRKQLSSQSSEHPLPAIKCLQKRHTRKWHYLPSVVVAKVNLGRNSMSESGSQTCSEYEGVEHHKLNSKLPLPLSPTVSDPSGDTHSLERSQPETINLVDEEVEFTQNGTQYNYGPLEKVACETSLSDRESETVVSDSTASLSPIFLKKPSLPHVYGFRKRC